MIPKAFVISTEVIGESTTMSMSKEGITTAKSVGSTVLGLDVLITKRRRLSSLPPVCLEPRFGKGQTVGDGLEAG